MITASELEKKSRNFYVVGEEFKLNNGLTVMIPSMPIGSVSAKFIRMRDAMSEPEEIEKRENGVACRDENGRIIFIKNPKHIDPNTDKGMEFFGKMMHAILGLNFDLTEAECDGLFSMSHFNNVFTWFFTGKKVSDVQSQAARSAPNESAETDSSKVTAKEMI